jgi:hypothetical protein
MSQMTATARAALRAPATGRDRQAPRLRVVTGRQARQSSAGFVLLCTALLVATMLTLLVLNTSRAEASFRISDLQATSGLLADTESGLRADLATERSPQHLATRAKSLGMVPSQTAAFIRTSDGAVLGVAKKAEPQPDFTVVHEAAPQPAAPAAASPSAATPATVVSAATRAADAASQEEATRASTSGTSKAATQQQDADRTSAEQDARTSTKDSTTTKR